MQANKETIDCNVSTRKLQFRSGSSRLGMSVSYKSRALHFVWVTYLVARHENWLIFIDALVETRCRWNWALMLMVTMLIAITRFLCIPYFSLFWKISILIILLSFLSFFNTHWRKQKYSCIYPYFKFVSHHQ